MNKIHLSYEAWWSREGEALTCTVLLQRLGAPAAAGVVCLDASAVGLGTVYVTSPEVKDAVVEGSAAQLFYGTPIRDLDISIKTLESPKSPTYQDPVNGETITFNPFSPWATLESIDHED